MNLRISSIEVPPYTVPISFNCKDAVAEYNTAPTINISPDLNDFQGIRHIFKAAVALGCGMNGLEKKSIKHACGVVANSFYDTMVLPGIYEGLIKEPRSFSPPYGLSVEFVDDIDGHGQTKMNLGEMKINSDLFTPGLSTTIIHEMIHFVDWVYNHQILKEKHIECLGVVLYGILKNNDWSKMISDTMKDN